jgi:hypothetical protein
MQLCRRNIAARGSMRSIRALGASFRVIGLRPGPVPDASRTRVGTLEAQLRLYRQIEVSRRRVLTSCRSPARRFTSRRLPTRHVVGTFAQNILARCITQKPTRKSKIQPCGGLSRQIHCLGQQSLWDTSRWDRPSRHARFDRPQLSPPVRPPSATSPRGCAACASDPPHKQSEPRPSCPGGLRGRTVLNEEVVLSQ